VSAGVVNAMTCDVEDYFQVQAFFDHIDRKDWPNRTPRVEQNTDRVLALFDAAGVKGTFFTLGWVAERHPQVVRRIVAQGHELASHGMAHFRADAQTPDEFRADISHAKALLEDVGGVAVLGYRAASFSIGARNLWAFDVLGECGYAYSSSVYPVKHDIYGMPEAPRTPFRPKGANGVLEVPISTVSLLGRNLPCGGGGYFRLLPYAYSRWAIGHVNRSERRPTVFYFHPWEVDPEQPVTPGIGLKTRVRHYTNLGRMAGRLARVLRAFRWDRMDHVFLAPEQARQRAA
jgi:polysaccharide deacetylase family protein (PEP-CTERM system associated)